VQVCYCAACEERAEREGRRRSIVSPSEFERHAGAGQAKKWWVGLLALVIIMAFWLVMFLAFRHWCRGQAKCWRGCWQLNDALCSSVLMEVALSGTRGRARPGSGELEQKRSLTAMELG